jgi:hypothetical protein
MGRATVLPVLSDLKGDHMNDPIEQQIQDKGLTAPRVTLEDIEANIVGEYYFTAGEAMKGKIAEETAPGVWVELGPDPALSLLTFCVLVLQNGFTVTGESACASPENFDPEIGRSIARKSAVSKVWPLMGYELRTILSVIGESQDGFNTGS